MLSEADQFIAQISQMREQGFNEVDAGSSDAFNWHERSL